MNFIADGYKASLNNFEVPGFTDIGFSFLQERLNENLKLHEMTGNKKSFRQSRNRNRTRYRNDTKAAKLSVEKPSGRNILWP